MHNHCCPSIPLSALSLSRFLPSFHLPCSLASSLVKKAHFTGASIYNGKACFLCQGSLIGDSGGHHDWARTFERSIGRGSLCRSKVQHGRPVAGRTSPGQPQAQWHDSSLWCGGGSTQA